MRLQISLPFCNVSSSIHVRSKPLRCTCCPVQNRSIKRSFGPPQASSFAVRNSLEECEDKSVVNSVLFMNSQLSKLEEQLLNEAVVSQFKEEFDAQRKAISDLEISLLLCAKVDAHFIKANSDLLHIMEKAESMLLQGATLSSNIWIDIQKRLLSIYESEVHRKEAHNTRNMYNNNDLEAIIRTNQLLTNEVKELKTKLESTAMTATAQEKKIDEYQVPDYKSYKILNKNKCQNVLLDSSNSDIEKQYVNAVDGAQKSNFEYLNIEDLLQDMELLAIELDESSKRENQLNDKLNALYKSNEILREQLLQTQIDSTSILESWRSDKLSLKNLQKEVKNKN